jgi:hypothetical protein
MAKIIKLHTKESYDTPSEECTICRCNFNPDAEGGLCGSLGILPIQFCPTCLSGVISMVEFLWDKKDKDGKFKMSDDDDE